MSELDSQINTPLYLATWKRALAAFLGWSEGQTLQWAEQYADGLCGANQEFYRETPIYYVVPLLIPDGLKRRLNVRQLMKLEREVQQAIEYGAMNLPERLEKLKESMPLSEYAKEFDRFYRDATERGIWFTETRADEYDWTGAKARVDAILRRYED